MNVVVFLVGLLLTVGGAAYLFFQRWSEKKGKGGVPLIILGLAVIICSQCFEIIPTGYTGVRATFGQISEAVVPQGFSWKAPFVQSIESVNNKQQDTKLAAEKDAKIWGESSDKVQVYMSDVTITYQISSEKSSWIYAHVSNYRENLLSGSLAASALKNSTNELLAGDVTNRGKIEPLACKNLQAAVNEKYGQDTVAIIKVVVNDMNFEDSYNEAIAKKNIAQQQYEQAQIENKKSVEKAKADADAAKIAAQGKAEAAVTEAEGQAEANRKIQNSITDVILKQEFYDKWNGQLPKVMGDNQSIIDIGEVGEEKQNVNGTKE